jgi:hypothetical protein
MKRYDLDEFENNEGCLEISGMTECDSGDWVRYEDAVTEINNLTGTQTDECARLRAQRDDQAIAFDLAAARADSAESRVRELESENDRLRLDADAWHNTADGEMKHRQAVESSLAAATKLLERWQANAGGFGPTSLYRDTADFLPNQPAAPAPNGCGLGRCGTVTECADCGRAPGKAPNRTEAMGVEQTWFSIGGARISLGSIKAALSLNSMVVHEFEHCPACGAGPCTPACPEREWRYKTRTEAERAVLDAMAEVDAEEPSLRDLLPAVRAERARRGLK